MRSSLAVFLLVWAGCSKPAAPAFRVVALPPFEDLGGGVEAQALRLGLLEAIQGQTAAGVVTPSHRRELPDSGATNVVEGYATPSAFHLVVDRELLSCEGTLATCGARLIGQAAARLGLTPRTSFDAKAAAAIAAAVTVNQETAWRSAVSAAPLNSFAWAGLAASVAAKQGAAAAARELAAARVSDMSEYDRVRILLLQAETSGDRARQAKALAEFARLNPADLALQRRASESAVAARDFAGAANILGRTIAWNPALEFVNDAAYAASFAGMRSQAVEYASRLERSGQTRYMDTAGDVSYFHGDYAAAARQFEAVAAVDAAFLRGEIHWKIACAQLLAGQAGPAEKSFAQFASLREKAGQNVSLHREAWKLFRANRKPTRDSFRAGLSALLPLIDKSSPMAAAIRALLTGPVPSDGSLAAYFHYLRGDDARARESLASVIGREHPFSGGSLRLLEVRLSGKAAGTLPPRADDFLAAIL